MPQDGTQLPQGGMTGGDTSGLGTGGGYGMMNPLVMGYGIPGQMLGYSSGGIQDPAWLGAMNRQRYAMSLLGQASQVSPLRSPVQAFARALSGVLGGWEERSTEQTMANVASRMQQQAAQGMQQAQDIIGSVTGGVGQGPVPGGAGGQWTPAAGGGVQPPGSASVLAALPDVQKLPATIQGPLVTAMTNAGLSPSDAALYARMVNHESGGNQMDPQNPSKVLMNRSGSSATGAGQLMPGTFAAMKAKYGIPGDITDATANLTAGARYFQEGLARTNGDQTAALVRYSEGDGGLNKYLGGNLGGLLDQTKQYMASVQPNAPGNIASYSTAAGPAGPGGGPAPGSGFQAALRLQMLGAQMAANPLNPFAQAMGRNLLAMAPTLARIGAAGTPQAVPGQPGLYYQINPVTGDLETRGQPQNQDVADMGVLTSLGQKPWNQMTPQEQQTYQGAYNRQGAPSLAFNKDAGGWTYAPSTRLPPNITVPPGSMAGALPGRAPGAAPPAAAPAPPAAAPAGPQQFTYPNGKIGGPPDANGGVHYTDGTYGTPPGPGRPAAAPAQPPMAQPPPPPTTGPPVTQPTMAGGPHTGEPAPSPAQIESGQNQIGQDRIEAANLRAQGLEAQPMRMLTDQIRALMASGRVQTGALAPLALEVSRIAQGLGFDPGLIQQVTAADPATGELLNKLFTQFSTQATRAMGAHEAGSVVQLFMRNYPSIESRPETIQEFTRAIDMQNLFTQRRGELAQLWMDQRRGDPQNYQSISSPAFNAWAKTQGLDPRIYATAALMAGGQPHKAWASNLGRGAVGNAEADAAARLAWSVYPGVAIVGANGNIHYGEGL